jgi:hypothetical protein
VARYSATLAGTCNAKQEATSQSVARYSVNAVSVATADTDDSHRAPGRRRRGARQVLLPSFLEHGGAVVTRGSEGRPAPVRGSKSWREWVSMAWWQPTVGAEECLWPCRYIQALGVARSRRPRRAVARRQQTC